MGKIKIVSKRGGLMSFYDMKIYLDGHLFGLLPVGGSKDFDVPTGEHKLKAKLGLYQSKEFAFTLFNKDNSSFTVSINKILNINPLLFILAAVIMEIICANYFPGNLFSRVFPLIVVIITMYFFLIGRKFFLVFREESKNK